VKLGIRILDQKGHVLLQRGAFEIHTIPVPENLAAAAKNGIYDEFDLGEPYSYISIVANIPNGFAQIVINDRRFRRSIRDVSTGFLVSIPIALAMTGLLGWWLARSILSPLRNIIGTSQRITASQLEGTIPTSGSGDEIDQLSQTLNAMMGRVRNGFERLHAFSSNVAHQLRNPLSRLRNRLETAAETPRAAQTDQQVIEASLDDVVRIEKAIRGLLQLAQSESGLPPERCKLLKLSALIESVIDFFEPLASKQGLTLESRLAKEATISGEPDWLRELFANLLDNAIKYTSAPGTIRVEMHCQPPHVLVSVWDTGRGMSVEEIHRIFERFGRGKEVSSVPGMGSGFPSRARSPKRTEEPSR